MFYLRCFNSEICKLMFVRVKIGAVLEELTITEIIDVKGTCTNNVYRKMYSLVTLPISHNF